LRDFKPLNQPTLKKVLIFFLCLPLLIACSDNKGKSKPIVKAEEKGGAIHRDTEMSAEDSLIKNWLQEKEWKSESEAAPITTMKLHRDGMGEFTYGKDPWVYKNGFFAMHSLDFVKWPLKKIDDLTFTLFVEPTQKTYTYKFIKPL
jgi:hypothetical protein